MLHWRHKAGSGINYIGADANIGASALGTAAISGDQRGVTWPLTTYSVAHTAYINYTGVGLITAGHYRILCGCRRCFVAIQLSFITRIREEDCTGTVKKK